MAEAQPLNSAQLAAIREQYESHLRAAVAGLQVRKWIVDQLLSKGAFTWLATVDDTMALAERLHAFIVDSALRPLSSDLSDKE